MPTYRTAECGRDAGRGTCSHEVSSLFVSSQRIAQLHHPLTTHNDEANIRIIIIIIMSFVVPRLQQKLHYSKSPEPT